MILLHAMGGLPGGGLTYLCFGIVGMLADVNFENGGLPWLVWSDWLVTAPLSCDLQIGCIYLLSFLHLPSISRAWLVPVNMLFSLIFLLFSIFCSSPIRYHVASSPSNLDAVCHSC